MWNKTQVQNITVLSDNWFQTSNTAGDSFADSNNPPLPAIPSYALWVLFIHAAGSYICYITGTLSVIRCIQICLQQNPKGLQYLPFQPGCHLPKNCTWAQSVTFAKKFFFSGKLLVQNLTANPVISEAFPRCSSAIQGKSMDTTLN